MIFKCKICGGTLEIQQDSEIAVCEYCGTKQTLPKLSDEKRVHLYERANHFRRNNEYDKAMGIYEMILNEDGTDAEAYWSLVLCKYGVEYVEDPATRKRVPTCNRTLNTSVLADEDYKEAIRNASSMTRGMYEEEAKRIDEIQREILAISAKEDAYDIFISYKESDEKGRRTRDSVLAYDVYQQLTKEGYRVFFSRVSLEDVIGTAYEPYIYSALSSSQVMIVVGTEKEHFNAVWVKNEWGRFLNMMKTDPEKVLIPAYRDMDPYDLPDELSYLQAQDMGKLGFMQDLLRGIEKIMQKKKQAATHTNSGESAKGGGTGVNIDNLLLRIDSFLQDGDFEKAQEYCDKVLDIKIDETRVYVAQLRIYVKKRYGIRVSSEAVLYAVPENLSKNANYLNALKYAEGEYKDKLQQMAINNKKYCYEKVIKPQIVKGKIPEQMYIDLIHQFVGEPGDDRWQLFLDYFEAMKAQSDEEALLSKLQKEEGESRRLYDTLCARSENAETELSSRENELSTAKMIVGICWGLTVAAFIFVAILCALETDTLLMPACFAFWIFLFVAIAKTRKNNIKDLSNRVGAAWSISNSADQEKNQVERVLNEKREQIERKKNAVLKSLSKVQEVKREIDVIFATEHSDADEPGGENGIGQNINSSRIRYELGTVAFVCEQCGSVSINKTKPFKCMACNADGKQIARKQYTETGWK